MPELEATGGTHATEPYFPFFPSVTPPFSQARPSVDDIWMTGAVRFVPLNVARQRFPAALRRKIAGRFHEHLEAKKETMPPHCSREG
ncbi:hypothetical protein [Bradyrhizobium sp. Leo170]|uniref:hypothetical protein n=1 Tax=Bradyrhizobium sp. Leo170 TaxID=1571199 RepID=UPI0013EE75B0|nr:hypothetical protein [Bradyrhizobium sp. Leo170]